MARPREPVALVVAKGKKHLTKEEIAERQAREIQVPFTDIKPPRYLNTKQKKTFKDLAGKLLAIKIYTELDADALARYIIAQDLYISYTEAINELIEKGNLVLLKEVQNMQDKAFRQAQSSARDLGLTISSRCRLEVPVKEEAPKQNKFAVFGPSKKAVGDA